MQHPSQQWNSSKCPTTTVWCKSHITREKMWWLQANCRWRNIQTTCRQVRRQCYHHKPCTKDGTHATRGRYPFWSRSDCPRCSIFDQQHARRHGLPQNRFCKRIKYRQKRLPGGSIQNTCPRSLSIRKTLLQTLFVFVLRWLSYPFRKVIRLHPLDSALFFIICSLTLRFQIQMWLPWCHIGRW